MSVIDVLKQWPEMADTIYDSPEYLASCYGDVAIKGIGGDIILIKFKDNKSSVETKCIKWIKARNTSDNMAHIEMQLDPKKDWYKSIKNAPFIHSLLVVPHTTYGIKRYTSLTELRRIEFTKDNVAVYIGKCKAD